MEEIAVALVFARLLCRRKIVKNFGSWKSFTDDRCGAVARHLSQSHPELVATAASVFNFRESLTFHRGVILVVLSLLFPRREGNPHCVQSNCLSGWLRRLRVPTQKAHVGNSTLYRETIVRGKSRRCVRYLFVLRLFVCTFSSWRSRHATLRWSEEQSWQSFGWDWEVSWRSLQPAERITYSIQCWHANRPHDKLRPSFTKCRA